MNTAYTETQYEMNYPSGVEYHWWHMARSRFVADLVHNQHLDNEIFLEVGCGKGLEVKALRDAGIDVCGVELADVRPLEDVRRFVAAGTDAVNLPAEHRNRVTGLLLLDVIEHLPNPAEFLKTLEQYFPSVSAVVITVPAAQEIWSNYDVYYGHHRRYSLRMLQELGAELNWQQGRLGYFFHLLYIPARLLALFGADRKTRIIPPKENWRWLHKVIAGVNRLDNLVLPRRIKGSSAFAVFYVTPKGQPHTDSKSAR